ncbi:MAG: glycerophosphodiester phosphodiesterase [Candidatus Heimdallarchaeota archaeon]
MDIESVLIIGHRGASSLAPENTLKAFRKSIELKADFIEFDVQITRDGELVITHDLDIERITGEKKNVKDMTLEELKIRDFGEGEKIPTLRELVKQTKGKICLNCEIIVEGIANEVIEILREYEVIKTTIVSSFKHNELLEFQKLEPKLKLASLEPTNYLAEYEWKIRKEMIEFCITHNLYAINPFYPIVDQQFVDFAHNNNVKVFPWTVDSKPTIRKLIKYGVDGIITNDITKLKDILNR